jgi:hypothetical protein
VDAKKINVRAFTAVRSFIAARSATTSRWPTTTGAPDRFVVGVTLHVA